MNKRKPPKAPSKLPPDAKQHLAVAKEDLAIAERELKLTLESLPVALRADKEMVSDSLRLALDKLAEAKSRLESVLEG